MSKTKSSGKSKGVAEYLIAGKRKISLHKLPANKAVDDSQFIPVIDCRKKSLPVKALRLEDVVQPDVPMSANAPAAGLINPIWLDNFGPSYGTYQTPHRFMFSKSTVPFTDQTGWYFNRAPFEPSVDHILEFNIRAHDLTVVLLRFQTFQQDTNPVIMTINADGRKFNLNVAADDLKFFNIYLIPNPALLWVTVSFDIRNQFNTVRHELCVTSIQLFETMLWPPPDLPNR